MPYDPEFYEAYRRELAADPIRSIHDSMFDAFAELAGRGLDVVDLGCGTCEFRRHDVCHELYHGIDLNHAEPGMPAVIGDYLAMPITPPFAPKAFVSLFSTELVLPLARRYEFYEGLFRDHPSIRAGMAAGFYYRDRADEESVVESHGLSSRQSIEHPRDVRSDAFREFRTYVNAPSQLFGPDVVEVWKFFLRNP